MTDLRGPLHRRHFIADCLTNSWIEPSVVNERALLLTLSDPLN
jgi:hypothetical protein